jgi:predicted MFS family arabinose efflux permease
VSSYFDDFKQIKIFQLIILAGGAGAIYFLPYMRTSYYDVMIQSLKLNNTQLGQISSMYGLFTMICYFPGGWLADRVSTRNMLSFSFTATGLGGFYYATMPGYTELLMLHVFFGITTTLTFWAALIKAARLCGPKEVQGRVYGLLEGVRRLLSTAIGFGGVWALSLAVGDVAGFQNALYFYSVVLILFGILAWFFLPKGHSGSKADEKINFSALTIAAKSPTVWFLGFIIFFSYTSYSLADYLTPYSTNICGLSVAAGATFSMVRTYAIGPFGAFFGGAAADKFTTSNTMIGAFLVAIICNLAYIFFPGSPALLTFVVTNMVVMMTAHFALRGIYYALFEEGALPVTATGIATGIVATVGYAPDAFIWTIAGNILDKDPGQGGYNVIFWMAVGSSIAGLVCTVLFRQLVIKKRERKQGIENAQPQAQ